MTFPPRRAIGFLLAASGAAGAIGGLLDLAGVDSPIRAVLVVFFFAVAPTIAIAGLLETFDPFARIVLAFTANIAMVALVAILLLSQGLWSPGAGFLVVAAITAGLLGAKHPEWYRQARKAASVRRPGESPPPESASVAPNADQHMATPAAAGAASVDGQVPTPIEPKGEGAVLLEHLAEFRDAMSAELADLIRVSERLCSSGDESRRRVGEALLERAKQLAAVTEAEAARRLDSAREALERLSRPDDDSD